MIKKNRIWHISDTHTFHDLLKEEQADIVIHSGDATNPRDKYANQKEYLKFLDWFMMLMIGYKIVIPGNHDACLESKLIREEDFTSRGIIYLNSEEVIINGLRIYGSPYTPTFGHGWAFNCSRDKIHKHWDKIPDNTDILVTHGPPKTILDLSYDRSNKLEFCGDLALLKRIKQINPKLVCFGHIHNCDNIINAGYRTIPNYDTIFSNGSVVTDGRFGQIMTNGNIFEI